MKITHRRRKSQEKHEKQNNLPPNLKERNLLYERDKITGHTSARSPCVAPLYTTEYVQSPCVPPLYTTEYVQITIINKLESKETTSVLDCLSVQ